MKNYLSANIYQEDSFLRKHSQIITSNKIKQNLRHPIINQKILQKFTRAKIRLRGYLLWLEILKEIREYGTNSNILDSKGRYRIGVEKVFKPKSRLYKPKADSTITYENLISPESLFSRVWNIIVFFMLLYAFIIMPWVMAFEEVVLVNSWFVAETLIDFIYFLDIIITLNTAYYDLFGRIIVDRKKIFMNYLRGLLLIDIISITPFYLLEQGSVVKSNSLVRIIRITSITRVLRGSKILKLIKYLKYSDSITQFLKYAKLHRVILRLLLLLFCVFIMSHFVACMWYYTAKLDNFGPDTWVVRFDLINESNDIKYLKSLYYSITILTTVGFGDIYAYTTGEMILTITWMMLGIGFYSMIISSVSSLFSSIDSRRTLIGEKMSDINKIAEYYDVDPDCVKYLKKKITDHINYHKHLTEHEKQGIILEMPKSLQYKIVTNVYKQAVKNIEFFSNKDSNFLIDIIPKLHYSEIKKKRIIYNKNEYADQIYFLIKGRVGYILNYNNLKFKTIIHGSYFGEIEVIFRLNRKFGVITEEYCEILSMKSDVFYYMMEKYPVVAQEVMELADLKDENNNECFSQILDLVEKVEIKKEFTFDQLAGKKQEKKKPLTLNDMRSSLNDKKMIKNINNEMDNILATLKKAKNKLIQHKF